MLIAVLLLSIIITLWVVEERAIDRICSSMIERIEELKKSDTENLGDMLEETQREWEKHEKVLEMLTPHENTDEININWAIYKSRIEEENYPAAKYALDEMSQRFKEIKGKMKVSIQNIF